NRVEQHVYALLLTDAPDESDAGELAVEVENAAGIGARSELSRSAPRVGNAVKPVPRHSGVSEKVGHRTGHCDNCIISAKCTSHEILVKAVLQPAADESVRSGDGRDSGALRHRAVEDGGTISVRVHHVG